MNTWISHEIRHSHCCCLVYLLLHLITVHVSCDKHPMLLHRHSHMVWCMELLQGKKSGAGFLTVDWLRWCHASLLDSFKMYTAIVASPILAVHQPSSNKRNKSFSPLWNTPFFTPFPDLTQTGIHISHCRARIQELGFKPDKVAELVSRTFNEMVFIHGDVHCDPHAANLFLRKNPLNGQLQLVLLDHGLYRYTFPLPSPPPPPFFCFSSSSSSSSPPSSSFSSFFFSLSASSSFCLLFRLLPTT